MRFLTLRDMEFLFDMCVYVCVCARMCAHMCVNVLTYAHVCANEPRVQKTRGNNQYISGRDCSSLTRPVS